MHTDYFADQLRLPSRSDAMLVNWVELVITHEEIGEFLYKNAFITDFEALETTVQSIVRDGRAHWKVENENNNILQTKGYHLEHNSGHGAQSLTSLLLVILFHTVMHLVDEQYRLLRHTLRKRCKFFQHVETFLEYRVFNSWGNFSPLYARV
ncbi:MAG: hypothetical protein JXA13_16775 [Anaerolineales bacterium]|nr:hypothetical protein [Anaerolineales bacterium]